jgi:flagellar hook-basal body complex protein FliE
LGPEGADWEFIMDTQGIERVLADLRATAQVASGRPAEAGAAPGAGGTDFGQVLKAAMDQVNQAQRQAQSLAQDFSAGNPDVNLQDVMVNLQKASLSFQQMVQVRNKLVTAYQEIMNMQV